MCESPTFSFSHNLVLDPSCHSVSLHFIFPNIKKISRVNEIEAYVGMQEHACPIITINYCEFHTPSIAN